MNEQSKIELLKLAVQLAMEQRKAPRAEDINKSMEEIVKANYLWLSELVAES